MRCGVLSSLVFLVGHGLAQAGTPLHLSTERTPTLLLVRAGGEDGDAPLLEATWRDKGEAMPVFDLQRALGHEVRASLTHDALLMAAIDRYLDDHVHFGRSGVSVDMPVAGLVRRIDGLVKASLPACAPEMDFAGLSTATVAQLTRLAKVDWSQARFGIDGGDDQDKYLAIYFYVRAQRQELERLLRADLAPFEAVELLPGAVADPRYTADVPTICRTVLDEQDFLCALDLGVGPSDGADVALTDEMLTRISAQAREQAASADMPRVRRRDRWLKAELERINGRIDGLDQRKELWALRDRLDGIEERLDDMDRRIEAGRADDGENPIAELGRLTGRNITIDFASGSSTLGAEHQLLLNEVFEQLARSPHARVLITGHADSTGDPRSNLVLSERRAMAVREHLLRRGVAPERLLVNHYGSGRGAADGGRRRVEVEWLP